MFSLDRWRGKVAVVTGASSGIGAGIVEALVKEGLEVVGMARRVERIQELANKLEGEPGKVYALQTDVSVEEEVIAAFQWITENVGAVHILINNAGLLRKGPMAEGSVEDWRVIFGVNVIGLGIMTNEAIKIMRSNGIDGHIININSVAGHYVPPMPDINVYPASKFAVTAICEVLRKEFTRNGEKIKITSLSPGIVETEIFDAANFTATEEIFMCALQPEDISAGIIYILSTPAHVQIEELVIRPVGEQL